MKAVILGAFALSALLSGLDVRATCNKDNHCHADKKIVRCLYSQKDLKRINEKNKSRLKEMGVAEGQCFYCGCPACEHSE